MTTSCDGSSYTFRRVANGESTGIGGSQLYLRESGEQRNMSGLICHFVAKGGSCHP
jgi:hypothetical protein